MTEYHPDAWVVVRIKIGDESVDKVMGGWYGGFAGADSWRLNSGITKVIDHGNYYEFLGSSGSNYICPKGAERATMLMSSILASFESSLKDGDSITRISVDDIQTDE